MTSQESSAPSVEASCPICSSQTLLQVKTNPQLEPAYLEDCTPFDHIKECLACEFCFRAPCLKNIDIIENYHQSGYWNEVVTGTYYYHRARNRLKMLLNHRATFDPNAAVLEVGSYNGAFLTLLRKRGLQNLFFEEMDPKAIAFLRKLGFREPHRDQKFEVIALFHVLEHYPEPVDFLKEFILSRMKLNAYLLLEVPLRDFRYKNVFSPKTHHVNFFNPMSIKALGKQLGLTVLDCCGFGSYENRWRKLIAQRAFQWGMKPINFAERLMLGKNYLNQYINYLSLKDWKPEKEGLVVRALLQKTI